MKSLIISIISIYIIDIVIAELNNMVYMVQNHDMDLNISQIITWFKIFTIIMLKLPLGCQKVGAPAHYFYLYKQMMNTIKKATEYNYSRCNIGVAEFRRNPALARAMLGRARATISIILTIWTRVY